MHEDYVAFSGETRHAFEIALQTLLPLGFEIVSQTSDRLSVKGPGLSNIRQNALLGISGAEFSADGSRLAVRADARGVSRIKRFISLLILGLGTLEALILAALWVLLPSLRAREWFLVIPVLTFIPWAIIAPMAAGWVGRCTWHALHSLLRAMAGSS